MGQYKGDWSRARARSAWDNGQGHGAREIVKDNGGQGYRTRATE